MQNYIGDIITAQRRDTRNGDTTGIATADFLRYNNHAQQRLQTKIATKKPWVFVTRKEIDIAAQTPTYAITDNVHLGSRVLRVDYSQSGNSDEYKRIWPNDGTPLYYYSTPYRYSREDGTIRLHPCPAEAEGKIRVWYERNLDKLALRNGQVHASTAPSSTNITFANTITTTEEAEFTAGRYICISDINGNVMLYNGVISSYNAGSDVLTLAANVSTYLVTGYALADLRSGYATIGKYTTTHSKLIEDAERYLDAYVGWKIFRRDSSEDSKEAGGELMDIEAEIVAAFKQPDKDVSPFPIVDHEIMMYVAEGFDWCE